MKEREKYNEEEKNPADYESVIIVYSNSCNTCHGAEAIVLFQRRMGGVKTYQSKETA